ncbi:MAG: RAMP superfamily CRISPR-associated protein, partial [Roseiflexus sp.]|nr:RAMP superfamily CRISPR-associated protein [Roseiflexus sp.]
MSTRLEFEIAFKSDYHIGAGHGLGLQVDSALLRDADGVPVIRGTALAGLLRESLANLLGLSPFAGEQRCQAAGNRQAPASYCGQYTDDSVPCPVCRIFGTPRHHKRWRISSARPKDLIKPQVLSDEWGEGKAAAQITTRVRVNPRTRRAEENKLFTREEGDGSLRFRFIAECEHDDADAQREAEWLVAAARMLRNLGAGKRRGYGECEIRLVDQDQEVAILDRFAKRLNGEQVEESTRPASGIGLQPLGLLADPGQHTYRLRVLVRLDEPLLIARRAEAGNQYETLETIPGSVLRGALAWRIARRLGDQLQGSAYQNFVDLFFRDTVRFSMLTPIEVQKNNCEKGYPTIVAPRDLVTCELHRGYGKPSSDSGCGVWSLFENERKTCPECAKEDTASGRKAASVELETLGGFIALVKGAPRSKHKPVSTVEMHIRIDPNSGRVRTGDLYGYVALEAGQYFVGEITCTNESVWNILQTMADLQPVGAVNELKLGKAAQRGYGRVSAVFQTIDKPLFHVQSLNERLTSTEHVTMLLLSDAIVPDPWGRFWRGFDPAWLKRELQLPDGAEVSIDCNQNREALAFSAVRTVDAFNAALGLPRSRDIALVAGSSVRLSFKGIEVNKLVECLEKVEARGIGLRRDEGFGRVAFNHPVYR